MDQDATGQLAPAPGIERPARSLFGEILDWMLVPLFLLWPISVAITYVVAQSISVAPYDRGLANSVLALSQQIKDVNGRARLQLPVPAREMLRADETDSVFYLVLGSRGEYLSGDRELPLPSLERPLPGIIQYRDDVMRGFAVRVAYTWVALPNTPSAQPALVQVAETLEKRAQLASEIVKGVILPQFVILPLAVVLVWFGLSRGIAPLGRLQQRLRARRPGDLSPIDEREVPQEIAPLVGAMNELLLQLSANVEAQKRFVADAAHQLKTPLAGIRTQAELALRNASPEDMEASLRHLTAGAERATRVVNQLLALARAEDTGSPVDISARVDLQAIASEQAQNWVHEAMERQIDLGFEGPEEPVAAIGNALLLAELINNLIDNALRYTPRGGTVTVRVAEEPEGARLDVEDSGPGIPPGEQELVFDRFYRILGSNAEGSGLGLAIVREIAQRHGATISVSDNPQGGLPGMPGTRISVAFPPAA
ncbi:Sensor protein QseC [Pigmentiphaga humi]|uniref:histidine kinase n=1 Tax=Pigmentiphaga humi TaxID=2478468 RepID=A0A3P4AZ35_9BURK|nr:sensor histidine kinase [Pigmentiphaga humi]VCU69297.1 Sensor protein QseC [Pigmentiphaga humi]